MEAARSAQPAPGFLEGVRTLCDAHGAVMIFDEVVTGFRYALGGAQEYFGVVPDMATLGKALGNGYPIAAVVGRAEVMRAIETTFVSSSYWSEPASMAAAMASQQVIRGENVIAHVWAMGERLQEGIRKLARDSGVPFATHGLPPVFHFTLDVAEPAAYRTLVTQEMARRGVHMSTAVYIMAAHQPGDIDAVLAALRETAPIIRQALEAGATDGLLETPVARPTFRRRQV